jgi:hypothetical protein
MYRQAENVSRVGDSILAEGTWANIVDKNSGDKDVEGACELNKEAITNGVRQKMPHAQ